jgi:hypothetical protein
VTPRAAFLLAAVALAAGGTDVHAQETADTATFTLTGSVADASTGRPLIGAVVKFPELLRVAYVQVDGRFTFDDFPAGTWEVVIEQLGYHTSQTEAALAPGNEIHVNLRPDPVALRGFEVQSRSQRIIGERSRKIPYRVVTLPPELFANAVPVDPSSIFRAHSAAPIIPCDRRSPSESSTPGCVLSRGGGTDSIWVYMDEGRLLGGMEELSMYLPRDIHSMEWIKGMTMLRVYTHRFIEKLDRLQISLQPLVYFE